MNCFLILRLLLLLLCLLIADVEIYSKICPQHHGFQYRSDNYSLKLVRWSYYNSGDNFWKSSDHNAPVSTHYSVEFLQLIYQQNIYATQKYELTYQTTFWKIPTFRPIKILRAQKRCQVTRTTDFLILNYNIFFTSSMISLNRFGWLLSNIYLVENTVMPNTLDLTW